MNILILSGIPRKGGNTNLLVEAFVKGASQKHHVEVVSIRRNQAHPHHPLVCAGREMTGKDKQKLSVGCRYLNLIHNTQCLIPH